MRDSYSFRWNLIVCVCHIRHGNSKRYMWKCMRLQSSDFAFISVSRVVDVVVVLTIRMTKLVLRIFPCTRVYASTLSGSLIGFYSILRLWHENFHNFRCARRDNHRCQNDVRITRILSHIRCHERKCHRQMKTDDFPTHRVRPFVPCASRVPVAHYYVRPSLLLAFINWRLYAIPLTAL